MDERRISTKSTLALAQPSAELSIDEVGLLHLPLHAVLLQEKRKHSSEEARVPMPFLMNEHLNIQAFPEVFLFRSELWYPSST